MSSRTGKKQLVVSGSLPVISPEREMVLTQKAVEGTKLAKEAIIFTTLQCQGGIHRQGEILPRP